MCKHDLFPIALENIMSICLFSYFLFLCIYVILALHQLNIVFIWYFIINVQFYVWL
jgi:hypothetical protein